MIYTFAWPGFESSKLQVQDRGDGTPPVLLIDGVEPRRDKQPGVYVVQDSGGNIVTFELTSTSSGPPKIHVDEQEVALDATKLAWHQWLLAGLPLVLAPLGGCVGGALGGGAAALNYAILRKPWPASLRYGAAVAINLAAFSAWLVIAVAVSSLTSSNSNSPASPPSSPPPAPGAPAPPTPASTAAATGVRPAGAPNLYVDNPSPDDWTVEVDGKSAGALPAYEYLPLTLKPGKHAVVVAAAAGAVDRIEVDLPSQGVIVLSPKALGSYTLLTAAYATNPAAGMAGGIGSQAITGRNLIEADYGLDEDLPDSVQIQTRGGSAAQSATRTRLTRTAPYPWPSAQALKTLRMPAARREALYNVDDPQRLAVNLFASLQGQPLSDADLALLLGELDKHEDQALAALVEALHGCRQRVSNEALLDLALKTPNRPLRGVSLESPAAQGVDGWAMKTLLDRGQAAALLSDLDKLTPVAQQRLLRVVGQSTPEARQAVLLALLAKPGSEATLVGESRRLLQAKDLVMDQALAQAVTRHIAALQDAQQREAWRSDWATALQRWASSMEAPPEWATPYLADTAGADPQRRQALLTMLAKANQLEAALEVLRPLPEQEQAAAIRRLAFNEPLANDEQRRAKLGWVALKHQGPAVREAGVDILSRIPAEVPAMVATMVPILRQLPDDQAKRLEKEMWAGVSTRIKDLDQAGQLEILKQPPAERWVQGVANHLEQRRPQRAADYQAVEAAYPQIAAAEARVWLVRAIGESAVWTRNEAEDRQAQQRIVDRGLADEDAAVRAAALAAGLKFGQADWPQPAVVERVLSQISEAEAQAKLRDQWHHHLIDAWDRAGNQDTQRVEANRQLLTIAAAASPELAVRAVERVDRPGQGDPPLTPLLLPLTTKNQPAAVREAAIQKLIWYCRDDAKGRAALVRALNEESPAVRLKVFEALYSMTHGKGADATILPALKAAAAREQDPQARERMAALLPR